MSKTDKVLYGGFTVVALASLIAMLVFVFSPPKQAEETVETPKLSNQRWKRPRRWKSQRQRKPLLLH